MRKILKFLPMVSLAILFKLNPALADDNFRIVELGNFNTIVVFMNALQGKWHGNLQINQVKEGVPTVIRRTVDMTFTLESPHIWVQSEKTCLAENTDQGIELPRSDLQCNEVRTKYRVEPLPPEPPFTRPVWSDVSILETSFYTLTFIANKGTSDEQNINIIRFGSLTKDGNIFSRYSYERSNGEAVSSELMVLKRSI